MYTKQALREIGIQTELAPTYREQLDQDGFFLVKNYFDEEECDRMATEFDRLTELEGNQGGHEVHIEPNASRISNIFNKTTEFDRCLSIEYLLQASHYLLVNLKFMERIFVSPYIMAVIKSCIQMCRKNLAMIGG